MLSEPELFMNDVRILLVLLRGYPHLLIGVREPLPCALSKPTCLLERVETRQDGPAYPCRVLAFGRCIYLDLDVLQSQFLDLVQKTVTEP